MAPGWCGLDVGGGVEQRDQLADRHTRGSAGKEEIETKKK